MRSQAVIPGSSAEQSSGQRGNNTHTTVKGNVIQQHFSSPRELLVKLPQNTALHRTALLRQYLLNGAKGQQSCLPLSPLNHISLLTHKTQRQAISRALLDVLWLWSNWCNLLKSTQSKAANPDCNKVSEWTVVTHLHFLYSEKRSSKGKIYLFLPSMREPKEKLEYSDETLKQ